MASFIQSLFGRSSASENVPPTEPNTTETGENTQPSDEVVRTKPRESSTVMDLIFRRRTTVDKISDNNAVNSTEQSYQVSDQSHHTDESTYNRTNSQGGFEVYQNNFHATSHQLQVQGIRVSPGGRNGPAILRVNNMKLVEENGAKQQSIDFASEQGFKSIAPGWPRLLQGNRRTTLLSSEEKKALTEAVYSPGQKKAGSKSPSRKTGSNSPKRNQIVQQHASRGYGLSPTKLESTSQIGAAQGAAPAPPGYVNMLGNVNMVGKVFKPTTQDAYTTNAYTRAAASRAAPLGPAAQLGPTLAPLFDLRAGLQQGSASQQGFMQTETVGAMNCYPNPVDGSLQELHGKSQRNMQGIEPLIRDGLLKLLSRPLNKMDDGSPATTFGPTNSGQMKFYDSGEGDSKQNILLRRNSMTASTPILTKRPSATAAQLSSMASTPMASLSMGSAGTVPPTMSQTSATMAAQAVQGGHLPLNQSLMSRSSDPLEGSSALKEVQQTMQQKQPIANLQGFPLQKHISAPRPVNDEVQRVEQGVREASNHPSAAKTLLHELPVSPEFGKPRDGVGSVDTSFATRTSLLEPVPVNASEYIGERAELLNRSGHVGRQNTNIIGVESVELLEAVHQGMEPYPGSLPVPDTKYYDQISADLASLKESVSVTPTPTHQNKAAIISSVQDSFIADLVERVAVSVRDDQSGVSRGDRSESIEKSYVINPEFQAQANEVLRDAIRKKSANDARQADVERSNNSDLPSNSAPLETYVNGVFPQMEFKKRDGSPRDESFDSADKQGGGGTTIFHVPPPQHPTDAMNSTAGVHSTADINSKGVMISAGEDQPDGQQEQQFRYYGGENELDGSQYIATEEPAVSRQTQDFLQEHRQKLAAIEQERQKNGPRLMNPAPFQAVPAEIKILLEKIETMDRRQNAMREQYKAVKDENKEMKREITERYNHIRELEHHLQGLTDAHAVMNRDNVTMLSALIDDNGPQHPAIVREREAIKAVGQMYSSVPTKESATENAVEYMHKLATQIEKDVIGMKKDRKAASSKSARRKSPKSARGNDSEYTATIQAIKDGLPTEEILTGRLFPRAVISTMERHGVPLLPSNRSPRPVTNERTKAALENIQVLERLANSQRGSPNGSSNGRIPEQKLLSVAQGEQLRTRLVNEHCAESMENLAAEEVRWQQERIRLNTRLKEMKGTYKTLARSLDVDVPSSEEEPDEEVPQKFSPSVARMTSKPCSVQSGGRTLSPRYCFSPSRSHTSAVRQLSPGSKDTHGVAEVFPMGVALADTPYHLSPQNQDSPVMSTADHPGSPFDNKHGTKELLRAQERKELGLSRRHLYQSDTGTERAAGIPAVEKPNLLKVSEVFHTEYTKSVPIDPAVNQLPTAKMFGSGPPPQVANLGGFPAYYKAQNNNGRSSPQNTGRSASPPERLDDLRSLQDARAEWLATTNSERSWSPSPVAPDSAIRKQKHSPNTIDKIKAAGAASGRSPVGATSAGAAAAKKDKTSNASAGVGASGGGKATAVDKYTHMMNALMNYEPDHSSDVKNDMHHHESGRIKMKDANANDKQKQQQSVVSNHQAAIRGWLERDMLFSKDPEDPVDDDEIYGEEFEVRVSSDGKSEGKSDEGMTMPDDSDVRKHISESIFDFSRGSVAATSVFTDAHPRARDKPTASIASEVKIFGCLSRSTPRRISERPSGIGPSGTGDGNDIADSGRDDQVDLIHKIFAPSIADMPDGDQDMVLPNSQGSNAMLFMNDRNSGGPSIGNALRRDIGNDALQPGFLDGQKYNDFRLGANTVNAFPDVGHDGVPRIGINELGTSSNNRPGPTPTLMSNLGGGSLAARGSNNTGPPTFQTLHEIHVAPRPEGLVAFGPTLGGNPNDKILDGWPKQNDCRAIDLKEMKIDGKSPNSKNANPTVNYQNPVSKGPRDTLLMSSRETPPVNSSRDQRSMNSRDSGPLPLMAAARHYDGVVFPEVRTHQPRLHDKHMPFTTTPHVGDQACRGETASGSKFGGSGQGGIPSVTPYTSNITQTNVNSVSSPANVEATIGTARRAQSEGEIYLDGAPLREVPGFAENLPEGWDPAWGDLEQWV